jgi:hypothetical protein
MDSSYKNFAAAGAEYLVYAAPQALNFLEDDWHRAKATVRIRL